MILKLRRKTNMEMAKMIIEYQQLQSNKNYLDYISLPSESFSNLGISLP